MLADTANIDVRQSVGGDTVAEALQALFEKSPGLRHHILEEDGAIRPHVSVFVDGSQADLDTSLEGMSELRILHAVSGG